MGLLEECGVQPGEKLLVQGDVVWAQIHEPLQGEKLKENIERQRQAGFKFPTMSPHYQLTLKNVRVLDGTSPNIQNYVDKASFVISRGDNAGEKRFDIVSKVNLSKYIPLRIERVKDQNTNETEVINLEGPIATGQPVTAVISTFSTSYGNMGKGLECVVLPVDFKYAGGTAGEDILKNFGVQNLGSAFTQGNFNQIPQAPVQAQNAFNGGGSNDQQSSNNGFSQPQQQQDQPSFNNNQQNDNNGGFGAQQQTTQNDQQSFQANQQPFNGGGQGFNPQQQQPQQQQNTVSQQPFNGFNGGQDFQQQGYQQQQQQSFNNGQQGYGGGSFGQQTPQQNPQFNNSPDNQPQQYGHPEDAFTDANPFD